MIVKDFMGLVVNVWLEMWAPRAPYGARLVSSWWLVVRKIIRALNLVQICTLLQLTSSVYSKNKVTIDFFPIYLAIAKNH